ncbi:NTP transferase domain-containing protein [Eubacteriaceae bacterium ES3]|nr:NTP transferase domain-containing protein [Eubacteriaceae bacterium ES3]
MITGIILASGFSNRMNRKTNNKLELKISGIPMVERVIQAAVSSDLDDVLLIYRDPKIKDLADRYPIKTCENRNAVVGQSESIKIGIKNSDNLTEAFVFLVGDQPFISSQLLNQLIRRFKMEEDAIIIPQYNGKNGTPVVFPVQYKKQLMALTGNKGGREIIKKGQGKICYEMISDVRAGVDIDTWDAYQNFGDSVENNKQINSANDENLKKVKNETY